MSVKTWFIQFKGLMLKEFKQFRRDYILMIFMIYAFTGDIYFAGTGVSLQLKNAAITIFDNDKSNMSRDLVSRFREPYFKNKGYIMPAQMKDVGLNHHDSMIQIDIPPNFEKDILKQKQTSVQMQIDTSHSTPGHLASMYATRIITEFGSAHSVAMANIAPSLKENLPPIEDDYRTLFNPNQDEGWFMSISQLLNIITVFAILLPGAALVREKERGTIEQLLVSPLSPLQILLPKVLVTTFFVLMGAFISWLVVINPIFNVPTSGKFIPFVLVTILYIFTITGLGLLAATFSKNMSQIGMITILLVAPMIFLSGAWTPPEAMNSIMKFFMTISPLHYFIDIAYNQLFKGAGLNIIWPSLVKLTLMGTVCLGLANYRFRKQFN